MWSQAAGHLRVQSILGCSRKPLHFFSWVIDQAATPPREVNKASTLFNLATNVSRWLRIKLICNSCVAHFVNFSLFSVMLLFGKGAKRCISTADWCMDSMTHDSGSSDTWRTREVLLTTDFTGSYLQRMNTVCRRHVIGPRARAFSFARLSVSTTRQRQR